VREGLRLGLIVLVLVLVARAAHADLVGDLATDDPGKLDAAVRAVEQGPADPIAVYEAARAADERLAQPVRALALYERVLRERGDVAVAVKAEKRAVILRAEIGEAHQAEATAFAKLVAEADRAPDVAARADALAAAAWPGAPATLLWLAEWLRRHGRFDEAQARYAQVIARWPDSREAVIARRGQAGTAIDARDWDRAEALASALPIADEADRLTRADLLHAAKVGRLRARLHVAAWIVLVLAFAGLAASLAHAARRALPGTSSALPGTSSALPGASRARRSIAHALRPPIEVIYGAPVAAVLVVASFTAHRAIGPAVTRISLVGLALAWLSGAALELRPGRLRAVLHVIACVAGVLAVAYIALTHDGLIDMLIETVRFGPDV
jgi:tetratricopeptide (TPR) repeat protein